MASKSDRDVLPSCIKPINYDLSIYDIDFKATWSYQGTVRILCKISDSTKEVILNAISLQIESAEFEDSSPETLKSTDISYDEHSQRATIKFSQDLPVCESGIIAIKFKGTVNDAMTGFYRSKYKPVEAVDGGFQYMLSTQFEACDARRAFPCFDEPNLKATFDFQIEIPEGQIALSNMPEKLVTKKSTGLQQVVFKQTPVMSTYLLAWAVGDFEYVECLTERKYNGEPLPVRVYTTRGLKSQAQWAVEHASKTIDYFSDIFGLEYPLPKADLLAVHEFSMNAMENWGLVTYRTTAVLYDEKASDAAYKNKVAYVVAHELAHQWFGNLVTMDWWNELWLNEGFATWVGWLAVDHIHPDWNVWPQFIALGFEVALNLDSLRTSHPIEQPVRDALDIDQIFDAISYNKGCSVIRMLVSHLGLEDFLKGVSVYLKAHAYGNATTQDLWSALSESSGQDVNALMGPWISKIGFPVLTVTEKPGQISLRQSRYLLAGDVKAAEDETTWWIPLGLQGHGEVKHVSLTKKQETIKEIDNEFYKINSDNAGFYRTNYPSTRLAKFGTQLDLLSTSDKMGLIADAGALAFSGESSTTGLLALLENFGSETNKHVWQLIIDSLERVGDIFSNDVSISDNLENFTLKLINPALQKLGWEGPASEDFLTSQLRALLITTAGTYGHGHPAVVAESKRRFDQYLNGGDSSAAPPDLRAAIFSTCIANGGRTEFEALKKEWRDSKTADGKEVAIKALGGFQKSELADEYLKLMFEGVAAQDIHVPALAMAKNSVARHALWYYIKTNFETIKTKLATPSVVLDRFLKSSLVKFSDHETEKDIADFFRDKDNRGYDRTLGIVSDTIRGRAAYNQRDKVELGKWLIEHGYDHASAKELK